MAKDKKSFLLYNDLIDKTSHLSNEEKGLLFTAILEFVNGRELQLSDKIMEVLVPIKNQIEKDLVKYQKKVNKNINNKK